MNDPGVGTDAVHVPSGPSVAGRDREWLARARSDRHVLARIWHAGLSALHLGDPAPPLTCGFVVVGTGVDPVTSRFSGARSTN